MASITDRIKVNLGISHDELNDEIEARIATGRRELARIGVTEEMANSEDELVTDGLIDFVCMRMASDEKERALWERAWDITSTALKDTSAYYEESE